MTDVAYPKLTIAENIFKNVVWDNLTASALVALFAAPGCGWMALWPMRQIITGTATLITDQLFKILRLYVDLTAIALINAEHKRAFDAAAVKLKVIAHDRGIDSDEFKKAREVAKADFAKFVAFGAV